MKTYTFIYYNNYPITVKKFHTFKKRFSSLSDIARFLRSSNKLYLKDPMRQLSKNELVILSKKLRSLNNTQRICQRNRLQAMSRRLESNNQLHLICGYSVTVTSDSSKVVLRVRVPLSAPRGSMHPATHLVCRLS